MANLENKIDELLDCMKFLTQFENLENKLISSEKKQAVPDQEILERASREEVARLEERILTFEKELALTRENNNKNLLAKEAYSN